MYMYKCRNGGGDCNSFDLATGSTQIMSSHYALNFAWGEHCYSATLIIQTSFIWNLDCPD